MFESFSGTATEPDPAPVEVTDSVLEGLEDLEPGPFLAAALSAVDVDGLSGDDRIVVLQAHQRLASHYQALVYRDMASIVGYVSAEVEDPVAGAEEVHDLAATEIRAALNLTRKAAEAELSMAEHLRTRLPRVWEALWAGAIDVRRAKTIAHGTVHLPEETARQVVDGIIGEAADLTSGQIYARLRKLCILADPDEARQRYQKTVEDRRAVVEATDAGTAHFMGLDLPLHRVAAASRRINHIARSLNIEGETRTMDQLRADVFLDLLCGDPGGQSSGGMVDIRVELTTLAELDDNPGDLAGYEPVIADIARQVAAEQADAEWRYTVTDTDTGRTLTGTTRRRPTTAQRRVVEARDPTCVFPGCRMPARECDLDHRTPWAQGGRTHHDELEPLCRHDHRVRHRGWQVTRRPDGSYQWTSLLGGTYITKREPP